MKKLLILLLSLGSFSSAFAVQLEGTVSCEADPLVTISGLQVTADRGVDNRSDTTDANGHYGPFFNMRGSDPWTVQVVGVDTTPPSYVEVFTDTVNIRNFTVAEHPDCPQEEPFCGDGILDPGEACDDGNNIDGDGCSANCTIEPFCGDGILDAGEQCDDGNNINGDGCSAMCDLEGGGEGCTPGYWRQRQHLDSWEATGYSPGDSFNDVFGVAAFDDELTLRQATRLRGGGLNALGRHAVAALLNAASPDVDYDRSAQEVIDNFVAAFNGDSDVEYIKDLFATFNEQGCPLN